MTPKGHTLRELQWMTEGKMELLGLTAGVGGQSIIAPYNPDLLKRASF